MSSLDVAAQPATSAPHVPVPVINREFIYEGGVIEIKVAADARQGTYPDGERRVPYMQFSRGVPGGRVNLFVHSAEDLRGKTIKAVPLLFVKELADGREYAYLDLVPASPDALVTHRLGIMPPEMVVQALHPTWKVFITPGPVEAQIVFAEPEAKFPITPEKVTPPRAEVQAPKKPAAQKPKKTTYAKTKPAKPPRPVNDGDLERLAAERGWKVSRR